MHIFVHVRCLPGEITGKTKPKRDESRWSGLKPPKLGRCCNASQVLQHGLKTEARPVG